MRFSFLFSFFALLGAFNVLASSTPDESKDIICHGKDCYPKVFVATDEFQIVKEDQIIPKGLHVRMDFNTGVKEAKLYDGIDDPSLQAVEVFGDEISEPEPIPSPAEGLEFLQPGAQAVLGKEQSDQGAIRPPPSGPDGQGFIRDTTTIISTSTDSETLLPALENLEDLSHDIYWGLRLGQDGKAIQKLNTLIATTTVETQIRSAAALLLGTAIQNNPAALTAALSHFYNDEYPSGPLETVMFALLHEQIPALTVRLVYLLTELCQDQTQLLKFIRNDGLALLRDLYDAQNANTDAKDRLRQKISNFVLDHFLKDDSLQGLTKASIAKAKGHMLTSIPDHDWTIVDKADFRASRSADGPLNAKASLAKWCEPFETSLKAWDKSAAKGESQTAREHVAEASTALDAKLKNWGCGCDDANACRTIP